MRPATSTATRDSRRTGVLAAVLGANLWMVALVVPTLETGARDLVPLLLPAPLLLGLGVRGRGAGALLLGVPLASLMPLATPELRALRDGAGPFVVIAGALAAYLVAALAHLAPTARAGAVVKLADAPVDRHERGIAVGLAVAAALVPMALVAFIDLLPSSVAAIDASHGHPESARALITVAAAFVSAIALAGALTRPFAGTDGPPRPTPRALRYALVGMGLVLAASAAVVRLGSGR